MIRYGLAATAAFAMLFTGFATASASSPEVASASDCIDYLIEEGYLIHPNRKAQQACDKGAAGRLTECRTQLERDVLVRPEHALEACARAAS